jgi:hypothetical protein
MLTEEKRKGRPKRAAKTTLRHIAIVFSTGAVFV